MVASHTCTTAFMIKYNNISISPLTSRPASH